MEIEFVLTEDAEDEEDEDGEGEDDDEEEDEDEEGDTETEAPTQMRPVYGTFFLAAMNGAGKADKCCSNARPDNTSARPSWPTGTTLCAWAGSC